MNRYSELPFSPGLIYVTAGVDNLRGESEDFAHFVNLSLARHLVCDWGDLDPDDAALNDASLSPDNPGRILSSYSHADYPDWKIWIITEWDRSATTILFPSEY